MASAKFTLPETHAAYRRWCEITGLDDTSPEWGEVWQVLGDSGLLAADRCPQRHLFEDPDLPLGETLEVRDLRLAVVLGALLAQRHPEHDVATATAIAAALLCRHFSDEHPRWRYDELLPRLERDMPWRVLHVAGTPADALAWSIHTEIGELLTSERERRSKVALLLHLAQGDDRFAEQFFGRLATTHHVALAELSFGGWLVYDCR